MDGRRYRFVRQATEGPDGLLHLPEIDPAAETPAEVDLEAHPGEKVHAPLQVVCDRFGHLPASELSAQVADHVTVEWLAAHGYLAIAIAGVGNLVRSVTVIWKRLDKTAKAS